MSGSVWNGSDSVVDSSRDRGKPFECTIGRGQVIKGWDEGELSSSTAISLSLKVSEGVPQLSLGEKALLTISPDYGYG
jgi:FK506-binding protein 1